MNVTASSGANNWKTDFYRNGYPKEVIVIEDSPTPPITPLIQELSSSTSTSTIAQTPTSYLMLPPAASTRSKRALREQEAHQAAQQHRQQLLQLQLLQQQQQQQQQRRKRKQRELPSTPLITPTTPKKRRKVTNTAQQQLQQQQQTRQRKQPEPHSTPITTPTATKKRRKATNTTQGHTLNHKMKVRMPLNNDIVTIAAPTKSSPIDDKNGYFIFRQNEYITSRFRMVRILGQGTFGTVIECYDAIKRCRCAIKVIRSIQKYHEASLIELRILDTLKKHDPSNDFKCIHLNEWFHYEQHICMVFDLLGPSVFDFLKANKFKPFSLGQIQQFAKQIFTSVAFLHRLNLVHTDLKPENVLLEGKPSKSKPLHDICLIDFGSATFEKEYHSSVVSTRHYRAPEIILDIGWSYPCDIWSIGCMLVEFFTGDTLFQTHENLEHLAMMQMVIGRLPSKLIHKSQQNEQPFYQKSKLLYPTPQTSNQNINFVNSLNSLKDIVSPDDSDELALFYNLLKKIFTYDPQSRITATEALQHPFFQCDL